MTKIKTNNIETSVPSTGEFGQTGGNLFDKYGSSNPVVRYLMNGFLIAVGDLARQSGMRQIHEIGCGEGLLSIYLAQAGFDVCGYDVDAGVISEAEKMPLQRV
jgi:2-polyprenyl-3-methyl-5-hydroxy-6-metoxy-1,4-benzoquinol methylase